MTRELLMTVGVFAATLAIAWLAWAEIRSVWDPAEAERRDLRRLGLSAGEAERQAGSVPSPYYFLVAIATLATSLFFFFG